MIRFAKPFAAAALAASALLVAAVPAAAAPCGGLKVADGVVEFGATQRINDVRSKAMEACLAAVASELHARAGVRSVTVAARVADSEEARRVGGVAASWVQERLAAHGLDKARISTVVPRIAPGEAEGLQIAFVERRSFRPVAQVWSLSGRVWAGATLGDLAPATPGTLVSPQQYVETGQGSVAFVFLLDGSRLRMMPESVVRIGGVTYSEEAGRNVQLELLRGEAEVFASTYEGPLRLVTGNAIAGVRGTAFRLALPAEERSTRLETLHGTMSFAGARAQLFVTRGEGSRVDDAGYPEPVRPLLLEPKIISPVRGTHAMGELLSWRAVPEADAYLIEFARSAQFDDHYWDATTKRVQALITESHTPGKWFWRVTAIDRDGFHGFPSRIYAFTVPGPPTP
ncbi:MAG: hypothetical protein CVU56_04960 [Deltaproteobacteria bacterium HGW-Deltaproteobacteria-14]|nr:MAG: hypothetical protein CVU56_04960 [Deltaproteobacteria bacterium HGW-Deltaproteobacteria-14]